MKLSAGLLLLATSCQAPASESYSAKVVSVQDGDTLTVEVVRRVRVKVRLSSIDAPERAQVYGPDATLELTGLCLGKIARISPETTDRYGRTVGSVTCDRRDASTEMIKRGAAWVYLQYASKNSPLIELQEEAKAAKRGLWAQPIPEAPWEWRKRK